VGLTPCSRKQKAPIMLRKEPLKEIIASTREIWDRPDTRPAVRSNFNKVLKCRTEALGSEVYASSTDHKVVHHTCKSRACASCGRRATTLWQREMWASLPDVKFAGVVFTMPDVLWPIFRSNRHLLDDLPALGAAVIQEWAKEVYGARLMIMVVRHTFGRHLNFNPHLHILASAGGLRILDGEWISGWQFDKKTLMTRWRYAVITYLREALRRGLLRSDATATDCLQRSMNAGGMLTFNRAHPKNTSFDTQADTSVGLRSPSIESLRARKGKSAFAPTITN
jgi:hypothetical protein